MRNPITAGKWRQETTVVPRGVAFFTKLIALLGCGAFVTAAVIAGLHTVWQPFDLASPTHLALTGLFVMIGTAFVAAYIALVGYVYGDARRRGMPAALWAWLVVLVPNCIGFIVYFILRRRIFGPCPRCGNGIEPGHLYCPHCGHRLEIAA